MYCFDINDRIVQRTAMDKERKMRACLMPSCKGKRFDLVHKFPMDNERAEMWRTIINVPDIFNFSIDQLRKRMFLCSKHFHKTDYKNVESRSLNKTAMPSLFLNDLHCEDEVPSNTPQQRASESLPKIAPTTPDIAFIDCPTYRLRKKRVRTPETKAIALSIEKSDCEILESSLDCSMNKGKFRLINADATTEPSRIKNRNSDLVNIVPMSTDNFILLQSESLQKKPLSTPTSAINNSINTVEQQRFFIDEDSFIKQHIESMIVIPCDTVEQLLPEPQDYLTGKVWNFVF